jgi:hypothetical protein
VNDVSHQHSYGSGTRWVGRWFYDVFREAGAVRDFKAVCDFGRGREPGLMSVANAKSGVAQLAVWKPDTERGVRRWEAVAISPADLNPFQRVSVAGRVKVRGGLSGSGFDVRMWRGQEFLGFFASRWPLRSEHTVDLERMEYEIATGLAGLYGYLLARYLPGLPVPVVGAVDLIFLKSCLHPASEYVSIRLVDVVAVYWGGPVSEREGWQARIQPAVALLKGEDKGAAHQLQRCFLALGMLGFTVNDPAAFRREMFELFRYSPVAQVELEDEAFFREEARTWAEMINLYASQTARRNAPG